MKMLKKEGYTDVLVQSLHIMNGQEYDDMYHTIMSYEKDFKSLKMGKALLTSEEDYKKTVEAFSKQFKDTDEAIVLMGHGTHHEANAVYPTLEYMFRELGYDHVYVGTVEGFPSFDSIVTKLNEKAYNKVTLMPLMLVAGDHASNDMAGDEEDSWKVVLKKEGFEVEIYMHGMGEYLEIQNIFIDHAYDALEGNNDN
jgi:sirohydrochlorin cobaltochelatase